MSSDGVSQAPAVESVDSVLAKVAPHAPKVMIGAGLVGLISLFLPAVTVSVLGITESASAVRDWRGKLDLVGYVAVAVMAGMMLPNRPATKGKVLACLITAGVALLLAIWLPLSIGGSTGALGSAVSVRIGIGCYVNILAALALAAGAVVLARREQVI